MTTADLSGSQNEWIALANTMGHAVLIETIKMAAYYVNHSNGLSRYGLNTRTHIHEAQTCYAFVQGTGLHSIIMRFGMSYDADQIKNLFNYCVRKS